MQRGMAKDMSLRTSNKLFDSWSKLITHLGPVLEFIVCDKTQKRIDLYQQNEIKLSLERELRRLKDIAC